MIKISNVSKKYNNIKTIDNLDITIDDGKVIALVGPNGAGKSTTINMIIGTCEVSEGEIYVNGISVKENSMELKSQIGYVSDDENKFLKLQAIEYLNFVADMYSVPEEERKKQIKELSERFNIADKLNVIMDKFSKGMKQKIMIISSLLHSPKVWILDEPFSGLDPQAAYELKTFMKEYAAKGNVVILSSHILEIVENLCDKVLLIKKGKTMYYGDMEMLKDKYKYKKTLEEIYMEVFGNEKNDGINTK